MDAKQNREPEAGGGMAIVRRGLALLLLLASALVLAGCAPDIAAEIAKRYPARGTFTDEITQEKEVWDSYEEEWVDREVTYRDRGRYFISTKTVPETAREIGAIRKPYSSSPVDNRMMVLRYDNLFRDQVVTILERNGQTIIEVAGRRQTYYRHFGFMNTHWGGGTVREGSQGSSTWGTRGGSTGFGK